MDEACLRKVEARFQVELHPSKLHNVDDGISEYLSALLFRYQDDLDGFVMAYDGMKVLSKQASIHPYFPLVHIEVKAQVLLFKPTVGCMLVGKVIKIAADFIGLLVLGVFNASIAADAIRPEFKCGRMGSSWASRKDSEHEIQVGTDVRFQVIKLQEQAAFFGIFGSMMDKNTGAADVLRKRGRLHRKRADAAPQLLEANGTEGRPSGKSKKGSKAEKVAGKEDKKRDKMQKIATEPSLASSEGKDAHALKKSKKRLSVDHDSKQRKKQK